MDIDLQSSTGTCISVNLDVFIYMSLALKSVSTLLTSDIHNTFDTNEMQSRKRNPFGCMLWSCLTLYMSSSSTQSHEWDTH